MAKKQVDKYGLGFDKGRQMDLEMRQTSLVCFCNHLKVAEKANYNEIHGRYSVINIKIQDYSQGKGEKSSFVEFNLDPKQVKVIEHWVGAIYPKQLGKDHKPYEKVKVYNDSYSKLNIIHASKNRNPFAIKITNGKADSQKKLVKGSEKSAIQWFGAEDFYGMWVDILDKLRDWEKYHSSMLFRMYEPLTEKALADESNARNQQQYSNQPNAQRSAAQSRNQQQRNTAQQNQHNGNNNGYTPHNDFAVPPPPPSTSNPEFEASFEETANYGSVIGGRYVSI